VDAGAIFDADLSDTGIKDHEVQQNLVDIQKRLDRVQEVAVRMRRVGRGPRGLLDDSLAVHTLAHTTRRDAEPGEAQTRFIEVEKETCLILDPSGLCPWAYPGTVQEAIVASKGTAQQRRALLGATVSLSRRDRRRFVGATAMSDSVAETGILAGILPMVLADPGAYSSLTGPVLTP
jgi:hypothetical protein